MTIVAAANRSIDEVLALLKAPDFCADATRTILEGAQAVATPGPRQERQREAERIAQSFVDRWGVLPPLSGELIDADPRRRFSDAIFAGRWGLLLISPRTTNRTIAAGITGIRSVVRKRHQDALTDRYAHLVRWLETNGFSRPTIARTLFGREAGRRLPSWAQVVHHLPIEHEQAMMRELMDAGLTRSEARRQLFKKLRGSEACGSARVRMSAKRYVSRTSRLNRDLAKPVQSEPLGYGRFSQNPWATP